MNFGVSPVHGGMIMIVNLAPGMATPTSGGNLFAACTVAKISLEKVIPRPLPFVEVILVCLAVVTYFSPLSLYLRNLAYTR